MAPEIREASALVRKSNFLIALTGAGISVESGIPDFRSRGGLWDRFDPALYAHIDQFMENPYRVWEMFFEMMATVRGAAPNDAHAALAELERRGLLKAVITQNIDGLHRAAGSVNLIEFHGNLDRFDCVKCGSRYPRREYSFPEGEVPLCFQCGFPLKPSVVLFGESVPARAMLEGRMFASSADVILVVGTSASVYPAAEIPQLAKQHGARIIEINREPTGLTNYITDIFVQGNASLALREIVRAV
jgi:NAD-dependent deacetylase